MSDYTRLHTLIKESAGLTSGAYRDLVEEASKAKELFAAINDHYKALAEGRQIRPTFGNEMQILYMRDRQTFTFMLFPELLPLSYQIGKVIGAAYIAPSLTGTNLKELLESNVRIAPEHKYGRQEIVKVTDNEAIYRTYECADCYGLPNIGLKICVYESGTAAGAFEAKLGKKVEVVEEKCCANGDQYCEFRISVLDEKAVLQEGTPK